MSRSARAIAASAALLFSLHMVSLQGQKGPGAAPNTTPKLPAAKAPAGKPAAATPAQPSSAAAARPMTPTKSTSTTATKPAGHKSAKPSAPSTPKHASSKTGKKDAAVEAAAKKPAARGDAKTASPKDPKKPAHARPASTAAPVAAAPLTPLTPVQEKLQKNTNLAGKLQARLPAGTNLLDAADGFGTLGQFVAAVNVSANLKIPFEKVKTDVVTRKMSLGQAIHDLRPVSSAAVEAQRAEYEAQGMIARTEQEHTTSLSATATAPAAASPTATKKTIAATAQPRKSSRKTSATGGL